MTRERGWRLLVVESPYAGDVAANVAFCEAVCRYAVSQGYAPYASHLIFTRFLDDAVADERQAGIDGGLAWARHADEAWFCLRPGESMSRGMLYAKERHERERRPYTVKRFSKDGAFLYDEATHTGPIMVPCPCNCGDTVEKWEDERGQAPCFRCLVSIICP